MIKKNYQDVDEKQATLTDGREVKNVYVRWLIDTNSGAKNFAMRRFEIKPGGMVPLHNHPEDHEIYVLSGEGKFYDDKGQQEKAKKGDVIYVPPNEKHGIDNLGKDNFVFICLIPYIKK